MPQINVMQLAGTHSFFVPEAEDLNIKQRLEAFDINPSGPLWGQGACLVQDKASHLEMAILKSWSQWQQKLESTGLKQERRSLRLKPESFEWQFDDDKLELSFYLPSGSYATVVLRELAVLTDCQSNN